MALSRKARIWTIILSVPVVVVIAAAIGLKLYFTDQRLKALLVPKLEETLHRNVALGGMSLSIFPSLAVEIDSLSIANPPEKGFDETPFVALDRLVLSVRLAPLFSGNVEVSTVLLEHPRLSLQVNEQGEANYALQSEERAPGGAAGGEPSRGQGEPTQSAPATPAAQARGLLLSDFKIVNGSLEYADKKQNSATTVQGLDLSMRAELAPGSHDANLQAKASIEKFSYGTLASPLIANVRMGFDLQLHYQQQQDLLTIDKGTYSLEEMRLNVTGSIGGASRTPVLDLRVTSEKLNIAALLSLVPKEYMKSAEGLKGNGIAQVELIVKGPVGDSTLPDVQGRVSATDASVQYARLPKPITNINVVFSFIRSREKQEFRMEKFSAALGNNPISATMNVVNFASPSITLAANAMLNLAEVKDYYPLERGTELAGSMSAQLNVSGKVSEPSTMKAAGTMDFHQVSVKSPASRKPVQNLDGSVTFNNQMIESRRVSLTIGKSDLTMGFWLKNYLSMMSTDARAPRPQANLTLTSNHLYTSDIMGDSVTSVPPSQGGTASTPVPRQAGPPAPAGKQGGTTVKKTGVALPNIDMDITGSVGTLTMEKFEFKNVKTTMKVADGVITMQNFTLNAFDGTIVSKGTLNLQKPAEPRFDLTMDMNRVDAHAMLPKFSSFGERLFGRMTMNTSLKGALDDTLGLVPSTLNGQGRVQMQDGKLTGVTVNKTVASLLKLPDLENITYKDWANAFTIANGRIVIKDLKISALDADYIVNGSQGFDGSLDYTMSLLLPEKTSSRISIAGFAGQAVNLFKDGSGRVKLDFSVGGTSDNPKVSLDTKEAQKRAEDSLKKQAQEQVKKKIEEPLKTKVEDALKGLFKKKK